MGRWRSRLIHVINKVDKKMDAARRNIRRRLGLPHRPLLILAYLGYGTSDKVYLKGRVIEDKGVRPPGENETPFTNLVNMFRRFNSNEVPGTALRASFYGTELSATTDEEGFFEFIIPAKERMSPDRLWHDVALELASGDGNRGNTTSGQVVVPRATARLGVISDVDDTVLQTGSTNALRMIRTILFSNARTRLPFKGVAAFYQALHQGQSGNEGNPLFYVSSGPWNLYDMLIDFFAMQHIPAGPLLLRDWGISEHEILPLDHRRHKMQNIQHILEFLPNLPFILIGDSGQSDAEIYGDVVERYPGRILAVYIRNVSRRPKRQATVRLIAEKVSAAGSTLVLADDTIAVARHAIQNGWISEASIAGIQAEKQADEGLTAETQSPPSLI